MKTQEYNLLVSCLSTVCPPPHPCPGLTHPSDSQSSIRGEAVHRQFVCEDLLQRKARRSQVANMIHSTHELLCCLSGIQCASPVSLRTIFISLHALHHPEVSGTVPETQMLILIL